MLINPAVSFPSDCLLVEERTRVVHERRFMSDSSANFTEHVWPIMSRLSLPLSTLDISNQTKKTLQGDSAEERRPKSHFQNNDRNSHIQPSITIKHRSSLQTFTRVNPLCYRLLPDPFWLNLIQHQSLCITGMVWSSSWSSRLETKRSMMAQAVTYHQCDLATFDLSCFRVACLL